MPKGFVLTAALQLQAPRNLSGVASQIQRQLNSIKGNINLNINPAASRNISTLIRAIANLNNNLSTLQTNALNTQRILSNISNATRGASSNINSFNSSISKTSSSLQNVGRQANNAGDAVERFTRSGVDAIKKYASFAVATTGVYSLVNAIKSGFSEAIEFQNEIVKISQVTGTSTKDLKDLEKEVTRLSVGLGVSSQKLINVSQILAQAGLSARDVKIGLEALAKTELAPTFTDVEKTVEGAIASMRQFNIGIEDLEKTLGSFNTVAGAFAVESDDIVTAVRRAGAAFSASGGTLNEFIALFTSVRQTTRESAETIATGFRTIFTRLQRPKTIEFLKQLGINLTDLEGKFIGPYEAVRKLSTGLSSIDTKDLRFAQIVEELGGFRQVSKVIPLIQQFAVAERALGVALRGETSLQRDATTAQESFLVQLTSVRQEFFALFRTIGNDSGVQAFGKLLLDLTKNAIKLAEALTPLIPIITTLGAVKIGGSLLSFGRGFSKKHDGGQISRFARGGLVPGSGNRDTVPALLQPGEFVLTKKAVQGLGSGGLAKVNRYAQGGRVFGGISLDTRLKVPSQENINFTSKDLFGQGKIPPSLKGRSESATLKMNALFDSADETNKMLEQIGFKQNLLGLIKGMAAQIGSKIGVSEIKQINHIPNENSIIGGLFEGALKSLGQPYDTRLDDPSFKGKERNLLEQRRFDFPSGLNVLGFNNIPTEAKKSLNKDSIRSIRNKILGEIKSQLDPSLFTQVADFRNAGKIVQATKRGNVADLLGGISGKARFDALLVKKYGFDKVEDAITAINQSPEGKNFIIEGKRNRTIQKRFANGGSVGTDTVPALLTPGEFVVNKQAAKSIGYGNLHSMNRIHKYAKGGAVGNTGGFGGFAGTAYLTSLIGPIVIQRLEKVSGAFSGISDDAGALVSQIALLSGVLTTFGKDILDISVKTQKQRGIFGAKIGGFVAGATGARVGSRVVRGVGVISAAAGGAALLGGGLASVIGGRVSNRAADRLDAGDASASSLLVRGRRISSVGTGVATGAALGAAVGSMVPVIGTAFGALAGAVIGGVTSFVDSTEEAQKEVEDRLRKFSISQATGNITSIFGDINKGRLGFKTGVQKINPEIDRLIQLRDQSALQSSGFEQIQNEIINRMISGSPDELKRLTTNKKTGAFGDIRNNATLSKAILAQANAETNFGNNGDVNARAAEITKQIDEQIKTARAASDSANKLSESLVHAAEQLEKFSLLSSGISNVLDQSINDIENATNNISGGSISAGFASLAGRIPTAINGGTHNERIKQREVLQDSLDAAITSITGNAVVGRKLSGEITNVQFAEKVLPGVLNKLDIKNIDRRNPDVISKELISAGIDSKIVEQISKSLTDPNRQLNGKTNNEISSELLESNKKEIEKIVELLTKQENIIQKTNELYLKRFEIERKALDVSLKQNETQQKFAETLAKFGGVKFGSEQTALFSRQRRELLAGVRGEGIDINNPTTTAAAIKKARDTAFALRNAPGVRNQAESAVILELEEKARRLTSSLEDLADNTSVLTALENELADAEEKRLSRRQFAEDFTFAGKEGRQQIAKDVANAFVIASNPRAIGTQEQESSALRILKQFEKLPVFGGRTGSQVIEERIVVAAEQIALTTGRSVEESKQIADALLNPSSEEERLRQEIVGQFELMIKAQDTLRGDINLQGQNINKQLQQIEVNTRGFMDGIISGFFSGHANGGMISYFAKGGKPKGSDTVPAMLTPGEFVIKKDSAKKIGYKQLEEMNKNGTVYAANGGKIGYYAGGGEVAGIQVAFNSDKALKLLEEILKELKNNNKNSSTNTTIGVSPVGVSKPMELTKDMQRQFSYFGSSLKKQKDSEARRQYASGEMIQNDKLGRIRNNATIAKADALKFTPEESQKRLDIAKARIAQQNAALLKRMESNRAIAPPVSPTAPNWIRGREAIQGEQGGPLPTVNPELLKQFPNGIKDAAKIFDDSVSKIPSEISLSGNIKPIEVIINGADAIASMEPALQKLVESKINEGLSAFASRDLQKDIQPIFAKKETV